ncbi:unnamed protein product [Bubo scandiacus]
MGGVAVGGGVPSVRPQLHPQDPLSALERDLALQLQIAKAARRLCREENISKRLLQAAADGGSAGGAEAEGPGEHPQPETAPGRPPAPARRRWNRCCRGAQRLRRELAVGHRPAGGGGDTADRTCHPTGVPVPRGAHRGGGVGDPAGPSQPLAGRPASTDPMRRPKNPVSTRGMGKRGALGATPGPHRPPPPHPAAPTPQPRQWPGRGTSLPTALSPSGPWCCAGRRAPALPAPRSHRAGGDSPSPSASPTPRPRAAAAPTSPSCAPQSHLPSPNLVITPGVPIGSCRPPAPGFPLRAGFGPVTLPTPGALTQPHRAHPLAQGLCAGGGRGLSKAAVTEELKSWHQRARLRGARPHSLDRQGAFHGPRGGTTRDVPITRGVLPRAQAPPIHVLRRSPDGVPVQVYVPENGEIVTQV